jgi:hypothetical protein
MSILFGVGDVREVSMAEPVAADFQRIALEVADLYEAFYPEIVDKNISIQMIIDGATYEVDMDELMRKMPHGTEYLRARFRRHNSYKTSVPLAIPLLRGFELTTAMNEKQLHIVLRYRTGQVVEPRVASVRLHTVLKNHTTGLGQLAPPELPDLLGGFES